MPKRITVVLDEEVYAQLRKIQAKRIARTMQNVPLTRVINDVLRTGLR